MAAPSSKLDSSVANDAVSDATRDAAFARAAGRCECTRVCPTHARDRCRQVLVPGLWRIYSRKPIQTGAPETVTDYRAFCLTCYVNAENDRAS